jgi:hypothetical protein
MCTCCVSESHSRFVGEDWTCSQAPWHEVLRATLREAIGECVARAAAGSHFFATLAPFSAISMLTSLFALPSNPHCVAQRPPRLDDVMPRSTYSMLADRPHHPLMRPRADLGIGLAMRLLLTFGAPYTADAAWFLH